MKELQKIIIDKITLISDDVLLADINQMLDLNKDTTELYTLTQSQLNAIIDTQKEVKDGKFLSGEEVNSSIDKWLEK